MTEAELHDIARDLHHEATDMALVVETREDAIAADELDAIANDLDDWLQVWFP